MKASYNLFKVMIPALIAFLLVFNSCKDSVTDPGTSKDPISAVLVDEHGSIVPSAIVTVNLPVMTAGEEVARDTTDETGSFSFNTLTNPAIAYTFTVKHPDFKIYTGKIADLRNKPGVRLLMLHEDTCRGTLNISTYLKDSTSISGVEIRLFKSGSLNRKDTTVNGTYQFVNLCAGKYIIRLYKKGCGLIYDSVNVDGSSTESRSFYLTQSYSDTCCKGKLSLYVRDSTNGDNLPNTVVNVYQGNTKVSTVTTDSTGHTVITGLCPGDYYITLSRSYYNYRSISVHFNCNDSLYRETRMLKSQTTDTCCTGTTTLNLKDKDGNAISGASVAFYKSGSNTSITGATDANGQFTASNLCAPAVYVIRVSKSGYLVKYYSDTLTACVNKSLDMVLAKDTVCCTASIKINIKDSKDGKILSGVSISVYNVTRGNTAGTGTTDSYGSYKLTDLCAPAVYSVRMQIAGYGVKYVNDTLKDCVDRVLDLALSSDSCCKGVIQVSVKDSTTGGALSGASGVLYSGNTTLGTYSTDSYGNIKLTGLCKGNYYLHFTKNSYNDVSKSFTLNCNDTVSATLKMLKKPDSCCTGELTVTVVDSANNTPLAGITVAVIRSGGSTVTGTTDSNGVYKATGICAPASYYVRVSSDNYNVSYSSVSYTTCNKQSVTVATSRK